LFHFDLYLCGISSLAHVGGVAATPILAASYAPVLVPVGVLLALLGYILGTGFGLLMARILSTLAPG
ncbi:MAG: putative integral rane protein, partial [Xanthomonadaceae bacterium]|nr:putative integral rane protein [Xanthomonadaceae bacterium]